MHVKCDDEGQYYFDMCLDPSYYIVQKNDLITGKQSLSLNAAKLIRVAIMQVVKEDEELKPYVITIPALSQLLMIPQSNIYRDIYKITDEIIKNPVFIKDKKIKGGWVKIPWVTKCQYNPQFGIMIKLNDELKPFLLGLKGNYTQYSFSEILEMKSAYSIRIYEMLNSRIYSSFIPKKGYEVILSVEELREGCNCEDIYPRFANFNARVIEKAIEEINHTTFYRVSYEYIKQGKMVISLKFLINTVINVAILEKSAE